MTTKKKTKVAKSSPIKRAGVVAFIVEQLSKASATKPLSKGELLKRMVKKFPKRTEKGMRTTVHCQVPSRLRKRFKVKSNADGFWIES